MINYIKNIDWLFLLFIAVVAAFWMLCSSLFKNAFEDKPASAKRIITYNVIQSLDNENSTKKGIAYLIIVLFYLFSFCGFLLMLISAGGILDKLEKIMNGKTWAEQLILTLCLIAAGYYIKYRNKLHKS